MAQFESLIWTITIILVLESIGSCIACGRAEYRIRDKCCPMCWPGLGLMVRQPCTPSSDTVCETLEGFYCLDPTKDGCRAAQRHSSCEPGQYISHTGWSSVSLIILIVL
uniref:TNFR-Cys domain-containing protein n=1 Tax=Oncorhynchus tshawytscha TaxID=74940 RepID=A0AAZ3P136_ONCTS